MTPRIDGGPKLLPGSHPARAANGYPRELAEARRVQQHLFPLPAPPLPGWDAAAACRPARLLAGDYCDLFDAGSGRVALALGDVCGKGLGPALVAAGLRALVRSRLPHPGTDLPGLAREINAYLLASTPEDTFVSLFLAVLEPAGGVLRYVNAGHPAPLLLGGAAGAEPVALAAGGPLLGVSPEADFVEGQAHLEPGGLLAVFSDGLTEAMDPRGRQFRKERVLKVLRDCSEGPVALALECLLLEVKVFCGPPGPADDVSVILLRRVG